MAVEIETLAARIFLTLDPLAGNTIPESMAAIAGDVAVCENGDGDRVFVHGEGVHWHRTRWAAQNFCCQVRDMRLRELRSEVERLERLERLDFGVKR